MGIATRRVDLAAGVAVGEWRFRCDDDADETTCNDGERGQFGRLSLHGRFGSYDRAWFSFTGNDSLSGAGDIWRMGGGVYFRGVRTWGGFGINVFGPAWILEVEVPLGRSKFALIPQVAAGDRWVTAGLALKGSPSGVAALGRW